METMEVVSLSTFCEICGQECKTEELVRRHMREEHGERGSQCPFCDLTHISIDQLNYHVNTAHGDILSPLRPGSPGEPYLVVESNKSDPDEPHVFEVSPRKLSEGGDPDVDDKFDSRREGMVPSFPKMDCDDEGQQRKEAVPMKVFHNSNESLPSSSSCVGSTGTTESQEVDHESPLRRVLGNLSPSRWSLRREKNEVLKDVRGLWEDVPSTSGSDQSLETGPHQWHHRLNAMDTVHKKTREAEEVAETKRKPDTKPKETLLTISQHAKRIEEPILCPICGLGDYNPAVIQRHIEVEHSEGEPDELLAAEGESPGVHQKSQCDNTDDRLPEAVATKRKIVHDSHSNILEDSKRSCPVCHIGGLPADMIDEHVNSHFEQDVAAAEDTSAETYDRLVAEQIQEQEKQLQRRTEEEHFKLLKEQYGMDEKGSYRKQGETNLDRAVVRGELDIADYYNQKARLNRQQTTGEEDGKYRTQGVITALSRFYHEKVYNVTYARLAEQTDHFASSPSCKGWGCGYRNLQMIVSAMWHNQDYRQVVFNGKNAVPSIPYIQRLIESAWEKGFDPAGAEQLGNRLANTRKWIGATEITALLHSLRVKCSLVDFHKSTGPSGTHPKMFDWVRDYFGRPPLFGGFGKDEAVISRKMPLYLQHQGHSRTIVGCEVLKDGSVRLLLFDPSTKRNDMAAFKSGNITGAALRPLRKTMGQMKHKQYQIVAVTGLISTDREYESSIGEGSMTGTAIYLLRDLGQRKRKQYQIVTVTGLISTEKEYEESKLLVSVRIP